MSARCRVLPLVWAALMSSACAAGGSRTDEGPGSPFPALLPASYSGILPCADCPGIRHQLDLYPDQAFVLRRTYLERGPGGTDAPVDEVGRWELSPDQARLTLLDGGARVTQFALRSSAGALELLDAGGQPIPSRANQILVRDDRFVALEPELALAGMYTYLADAGMFAECRTGWRLPVALEGDNIALERGYGAARPSPGAAVLVELRGRIAVRPSMEDGAPAVRSLVPVRFRRAVPGATCASIAGMNSPAGPATPALERTRWGFDSSTLAVPAPEAAREGIRLEFTADGLSAGSGCNQGTTGYRLDADDTLVLTGPLAATRKACPPDVMAWERSFFDFLAARPRVRQEPGERMLTLESGAGALRLRSEPMPSAAARQKFFYVAAERAYCEGVAPQECLQVRESPDQPWGLFYSEIIGFTHQPGIEYRLRVLEDDVPNPPADASSKRWFLDLIVEQKVVSGRP